VAPKGTAPGASNTERRHNRSARTSEGEYSALRPEGCNSGLGVPGLSQEVRQMPHSGQKCEQSGLYQSTCADRTQIALSKGDTFPPCRNHGAVTWMLIRATQN
jgi:hypothetical protein